MKNEKLYVLMVVSILIIAYSINLKFTKKIAAKPLQQVAAQKIKKNDLTTQKNDITEDGVFNPKALNSVEFLSALNKIQDSENGRINIADSKYTQAEFEKKLGEYLLKPKEEFEKWADENTEFFLKYKHIVTKKLNEVYKIENLSVADALVLNVVLLKISSDNKHNTEVVDYFIDLAKAKDTNYAIINLKESVFYSLSTMAFERDETKFEYCIKFLNQMDDVKSVQKLAHVFKSLNPTLSEQWDKAIQPRIENANKYE